MLLTGLIRDTLTAHFSDPLGIEEVDLRRLVWREDERTGILIESVGRWRGDLVNKRPAIVIKRNARQNVRIGIGDIVGPDAVGNLNYQTFWLGSHTVFCLTENEAQSEILATEVQRHLTEFGPVLRDQLRLYRFQVTEVGAAAIAEEARDAFTTPVTVGWVYTEMWKVEPEARKVRAINLSILLDGAVVQESR